MLAIYAATVGLSSWKNIKSDSAFFKTENLDYIYVSPIKI
jgi:hypothetical protein